MAIKDALKKSNPVILEPVMAVEVETPEEYTGFVMGDIPSRRGHDPGPWSERGNADGHSRPRCRWATCSATPPTCAPARRAALSYTMQFDSYEPVPKNVAEEIISKAGGNA